MSSINILVPDLPESIANATVAVWHKKPGDIVKCNEVLVEIEIDKVVLEIPASTNGILDIVIEDKGAIVTSRQVLGRLRNNNHSSREDYSEKQSQQETFIEKKRNNESYSEIHHDLLNEQNFKIDSEKRINVSSHIAHESIEKNLQEFLSGKNKMKSSKEEAIFSTRKEERIPMTHLRKRVAERLLEAQNSTATLTTFNEVNMKSILDLKKKYGKSFKEKHGIRLSMMSIFLKIVVEALKHYPMINASIDDSDVVYHNYFDVSLAVSTHRGLVTPVIRNADKLNIADIERQIKELATKGHNGKLTVEDLTGGNITITNGGIFGSLISTPIINPPQSAILGMHIIKDRPMAVDGKVKILPMMYLALSYDHRLIDGYESINFLMTIKELLEDPIRLLLDI